MICTSLTYSIPQVLIEINQDITNILYCAKYLGQYDGHVFISQLPTSNITTKCEYIDAIKGLSSDRSYQLLREVSPDFSGFLDSLFCFRPWPLHILYISPHQP